LTAGCPRRRAGGRTLPYSALVKIVQSPSRRVGVDWRAYGGAVLLCVSAAALGLPLATTLDSASLVLVGLLAVVLTAARFGRGPAVLAAGLSVLLFNWLFVPPRFSLAVADERVLFTFAVMLAVGLVVGQLTAGLRAQAHAAALREHRMRSLYEISRELGRALGAEQVAGPVERFAAAELDATAVLWIPDASQVLRPAPGSDPDLARISEGLATAAVASGQPQDGSGAAAGWVALPLRVSVANRGALAVRARRGTAGSPEEQQLLQTCAALLAIALERIHYIEVAQATALQIEGERLRNVLLSAISHDLRTPLASMVGLAESLRLAPPALSGAQQEIADAIAASARRMASMVTNLLDLARLQSGAVALNREWQPLEEVAGSAWAAAAGVLARHRVVSRLPADLPLVHIDAVLMERVLVNLLENAAKYSPAGSAVELSAAVRGDEIEIVVEDNGPGLPPGREETLFETFERGHRESNIPGVGLGLALCRAIVQAHGGQIRAEAAAGTGARFVIGLPLGQPPALHEPEAADLLRPGLP
jgi:two-component system, OmpR family, sensor histidine kinase KdpD